MRERDKRKVRGREIYQSIRDI